MLFQIGEFFANRSHKSTIVGHPMKHLSRTKRLLEIEVRSRERLKKHGRENSPQRPRNSNFGFRIANGGSNLKKKCETENYAQIPNSKFAIRNSFKGRVDRSANCCLPA